MAHFSLLIRKIRYANKCHLNGLPSGSGISRSDERRKLRLGATVADVPVWVTDGVFDAGAASVGCGHMSSLLMRRVWPLAPYLPRDLEAVRL
jgi:hypothetical protein